MPFHKDLRKTENIRCSEHLLVANKILPLWTKPVYIQVVKSTDNLKFHIMSQSKL